jgi:hypothetical protein
VKPPLKGEGRSSETLSRPNLTKLFYPISKNNLPIPETPWWITWPDQTGRKGIQLGISKVIALIESRIHNPADNERNQENVSEPFI